MAVIANMNSRKLKLAFDAGLDTEGETIISKKTYSKVKEIATDTEIYAVAEILANLSQNSLLHVYVSKESQLEDTE